MYNDFTIAVVDGSEVLEVSNNVSYMHSYINNGIVNIQCIWKGL